MVTSVPDVAVNRSKDQLPSVTEILVAVAAPPPPGGSPPGPPPGGAPSGGVPPGAVPAGGSSAAITLAAGYTAIEDNSITKTKHSGRKLFFKLISRLLL
ncbi:hypothetical protein D3C73_1092670 [compost metagenome]